MRRISRTGYVAIGTAAVVLVGGGVALAYWTASGSGTGAAGVGTVADVTITQTNTITGLYPAGPAQTIAIQIDNGNDSAVTLAKVVAAVTSTNKSGCTAADFAITGNAYNGGSIAGHSNATGTTATIAMIDTGVDQNACKGATVNLGFTAS